MTGGNGPFCLASREGKGLLAPNRLAGSCHRNNLIDMQQHFLTTAARQADAWVESAKTGEPFAGKSVPEVAREAMEAFIRAQKKFLDVVAAEVTKVTEGTNGHAAKEPMELTELARQASESFIEAQKKLLDVAGMQSEVNIKAAVRAVELATPAPKLNLGNFTRETVDSFVTAQKALLDVVMRSRRAVAHEVADQPATQRVKRLVRRRLTKQHA